MYGFLGESAVAEGLVKIMLKFEFKLHIQRGTRSNKERTKDKTKLVQDAGWGNKLKKGMIHGVGQSVGLFLGSKIPFDHILNNFTNFF